MLVSDIWADAKDIFGTCSEETTFRYINDAIELLVDKGDWAPLFCYLDICSTGKCVTLPSEVETPLAIMIDGHPALPRNELYRFHLNGPGETWSWDGWEWENGGQHPTMKDLIVPCRVVARVEKTADSNSELWVYGYDERGALVRTQQPDGTWVNGYQVPTISGYVVTDKDAPKFSRITGVTKAKTTGRVRLATSDWNPSTGEGLLLGDYLPHETEPLYRRIRLGACGDWVRMYVRRKTFKVSNSTDFIPLHHAFALKLGMRAVRAYNDRDVALGMDFESNAVRLLTEREAAVTPPGPISMQFDPGIPMVDVIEDS